MIDIEKFLFVYQGKHGTLNDHQRQGIRELLAFINDDPDVTNLQWIAYMLATTKHETANTWLPIAEYGLGKGKSYGEKDTTTGKAYYGRGYVQLTWPANYKAAGKAVNVDLYHDPDVAMYPSIAYKIMSWGMRKGAFTGVGLKNYINEIHCDYRMARKIINGLDCADKIAGYAVELEAMLSECENADA
jgi:hypothetical protein